MRIPNYTAADYTSGLQGLLPEGSAWPREMDAVWTGLLAALAPTYARSGARATYLIADAFPATSIELLPEWEATLGLPDSCTPPSQVSQQRQAAVVSKLSARGGQSVPYITSTAAALGIPVAITEDALFRVGISGIGDTIGADGWAFHWTAQATALAESFFEVGASAVGDPLLAISDGGLACVLARIAPAHTVLSVTYANSTVLDGQGQPVLDGSGQPVMT